MTWTTNTRPLLLACTLLITATTVGLTSTSCNPDPGCCCEGDAIYQADVFGQCPEPSEWFSTEACEEPGGPCMGFVPDCYEDLDCAEGEVCLDDVCEPDADGTSDAG